MIAAAQPTIFIASATLSVHSQPYMNSVEQRARKESVREEANKVVGYDIFDTVSVLIAQPIDTPRLNITVRSSRESEPVEAANALAFAIAADTNNQLLASTSASYDVDTIIEVTTVAKATSVAPTTGRIVLVGVAGLIFGVMARLLVPRISKATPGNLRARLR